MKSKMDIKFQYSILPITEIISQKSNKTSMFSNSFMLVQRLIGTFSRLSVLTNFFINKIFFDVFLLPYEILAILFTVKQNPAKVSEHMHDLQSKNF